MTALHDAVTDIAVGRVDYAMVGGAAAILVPTVSVAFNKLHMLSPDGACKSFDASGNGYTRSDGISVSSIHSSISIHIFPFFFHIFSLHASLPRYLCPCLPGRGVMRMEEGERAWKWV